MNLSYRVLNYLYSAHDDEPIWYICDQCSWYKRRSAELLDTHYIVSHFYCKKCEVDLYEREVALKHMETIHSEIVRCVKCDYTNLDPSYVSSHKCVSNGNPKFQEDEVVHICKICKIFECSVKSKIVEHCRSHHNFCYNCNMKFEDQPTIAEHFRIKHYYLKCDKNQCYFVGLNDTIMKIHNNKEHGYGKVKDSPEEKEDATNLELRDRILAESCRLSNVQPPEGLEEMLENSPKLGLVEKPKLCYGRKKKIEKQEIVETEPDQNNDSSKSNGENPLNPLFVDIKVEVKIEEEENW